MKIANWELKIILRYILFKKILLISLLIILLLVGGLYLYYNNQIYKSVSSQTDNRMFEVLSGEGIVEISQNLAEKSLINSPYSFVYYTLSHTLSLKPGIYYLNPSMTIIDIANQISQGKVAEHKVTIIEGWRNTEIADYLFKNGIINNKDKFLKITEGREGYLFPDTYRLAIDVTPEEIVKIMSDNFDERTKDLNVLRDDLILASIVEREANNDQQRYDISGVYINRLAIKMKLESCPTVSYAKGNWSAPTAADLELVDSPYNTYKHVGLPPYPISNPGLASIKAAQNPTKHEYYYFLNAKNGELIMSKTLDEHNTNKAKYLK